MPTVVHLYRPVGPVLVRASTTGGTVDSPPPAGTAVDELAWLATQWSQPELRDAITLASPDLAGRVSQLLSDGAPPRRAVHRAVAATASYLTRWQRRATPFGLFAGVTAVTIGPAGARISDRHTAVARADADWLTRVIDPLEQDHALRRTLTVVANSVCVTRDGRFIVAARPAPGQRSPGPLRDISTRSTRPVRLALACAATPVRFDQLVAHLADQLPQADPRTIEAMLHGLIDGQVLITNLRPPMTAVDPLGHVLAALHEADTDHLPEMLAMIDQLGEIHAQLRRHNKQTDPGRQAAFRAVATELMAAIVPATAEPPLAVDVRLNATISLPQRVLDEAACAAGVLLRVTTEPFGSQAWLDYHARFRARYGPGAVVGVRDLVADSGLGYPPGYLSAARARPAWRMLTERDAHVLALVQRAMRDGADEISLSDADIEALTTGDPTAIVPPARLELGVSVHATSADAMNRGQFELRITGAPRTHTSMAGRFAYLLPAADRDRMGRAYAAGKGRGVILAQVSFPPRRVHNENVVRVGRHTAQVVSVGEHPDGDVIGIDYLAVTADADQLYLIHAPTGRRVIAYLPHALAAVQMPPLARFLAEVGDARTAVFGPLDLGAAARTLPYAPRIRYRHTVLAPAGWWLNAADLTTSHPDSDADTWDKALDRWRRHWRVPARVIVCHDELRLPINLDDATDRRQLNTRLSRADRLELREDAPADRDGWLDRPAEFVIPMTLANPVARPVPVTAATTGTTHRPGASAVVHARLIGNPARFDDLLTRHLPAFADSLTDLGVLWWWAGRHRDMIRLDADQHLSVFFRLMTPTAYGAVAARLGQFADDLQARGLPNELVFAAYHEQPGRYGRLLTLAECVFAADTTAAIAQLRLVEQTGVSGQALAAVSMAEIAAGFAADPIAGYGTLLEQLKGHTEPADRAVGDLARDLACPVGEFAGLRALAGGDAVLAAWEARHQALHAYYLALDAEGAPAGLLRTLLREHHHRALGVDPDFERQTNHLARAVAMRYLRPAGVR
ncbi:lantibiotic dehydratase [Actinoplanes sp. NPDC051513]|uniref:lantibiotic dehydratase n=1 Tax=Actinoplanes sp. NPDC051513 TaxID=3363908 RepID=UPI00379DC18D